MCSWPGKIASISALSIFRERLEVSAYTLIVRNLAGKFRGKLIESVKVDIGTRFILDRTVNNF